MQASVFNLGAGKGAHELVEIGGQLVEMRKPKKGVEDEQLGLFNGRGIARRR